MRTSPGSTRSELANAENIGACDDGPQAAVILSGGPLPERLPAMVTTNQFGFETKLRPKSGHVENTDFRLVLVLIAALQWSRCCCRAAFRQISRLYCPFPGFFPTLVNSLCCPLG